MSAPDFPVSLKIYAKAMDIGAPFLKLLLKQRLKRGKEEPGRVDEKRGIAGIQRPAGPLIWIHAASVGETLTILPLAEKITALGLRVLLTTVTRTSAAIVASRASVSIIHQYAPLDAPRWVHAFLDHWQPQLALFVEQELWPNTLLTLKTRGIPAVLLNARLSEKSFLRWRRAPRIAAELLSCFDLVLAQSAKDGERLRLLGTGPVEVSGNLKFDVAPPPARSEEINVLQACMRGRPTWVAASTHKGEDEQIFGIIPQLKTLHPKVLTLLAPRHPDRGDEMARLAAGHGLVTAQRSKKEWPYPQTDIFILDSIGEMGLLYRAANIVFMGGSLVQHGGQNPIEPALLDCAVLYGPHIDNFSDIYSALGACGGAQGVNDASDLRSSLRSLFNDDDAVQTMAERAKQKVVELGGALERTLKALEPYLNACRTVKSL